MISLMDAMDQNLFNDAGELNIAASKNSSASDFDFNFGKWKIHNRKLKKRLQNSNDWVEFESSLDCYPVLQALGNVDHYKTELDGVPFEGITVRLFNPHTIPSTLS